MLIIAVGSTFNKTVPMLKIVVNYRWKDYHFKSGGYLSTERWIDRFYVAKMELN